MSSPPSISYWGRPSSDGLPGRSSARSCGASPTAPTWSFSPSDVVSRFTLHIAALSTASAEAQLADWIWRLWAACFPHPRIRAALVAKVARMCWCNRSSAIARPSCHRSCTFPLAARVAVRPSQRLHPYSLSSAPPALPTPQPPGSAASAAATSPRSTRRRPPAPRRHHAGQVNDHVQSTHR